MKNEPLEENLDYGIQLNLLRWKLNQKAKRECLGSRTPAMKRLQESRTVEISPYGLTRGVELNLHSYSTEVELPFSSLE